VYGEVPPPNEAVVERTEDRPDVVVDGFADIEGADIAAFTVTPTGVEVTVTGNPELSVICNLNDHMPTIVRAPVDVDNGDVHDEELPSLLKLPVAGASTSHWHE